MATTRTAVTGANGMVCSAHPLASVAGVRMLLDGGNAVDAAVAVASSLNVCEPNMSGAGGNGYLLIYLAKENKRIALDYMGRAPYAASLDMVKQPDVDLGPKSPMVPGNLGGWMAALARYGSMDRATVLAPAIQYAEQGFPLTVKNCQFINDNAARLLGFPTSSRIFLPDGNPRRPGQFLVQRDLGRTYRAIAEEGAEVFYKGHVGQAIARFMQQNGGLITQRDLDDFSVEWQEPITASYRGYDLYTVPPPCSGFQYLETLKLAEGFDMAGLGHNSADYLHTLAECIKLAMADRVYWAARKDPPLARLLSEIYAGERRALISPDQVNLSDGDRFRPDHVEGAVITGIGETTAHENTTSFSVVDAMGNAVSVTNSLGGAFGSAVVMGDTGVLLNNFLYWFDLHPESPNALAPGKKIEMCMAPCHIFKEGRLHVAIGTPGSTGILQTTPQMIMNLLDHGMNTQEAIEAPRFRVGLAPIELRGPLAAITAEEQRTGRVMVIESRVPAAVRADLEHRGHRVHPLDDYSWVVGGGHGVTVDLESGARVGGADPRRDGYAIGY